MSSLKPHPSIPPNLEGLRAQFGGGAPPPSRLEKPRVSSNLEGVAPIWRGSELIATGAVAFCSDWLGAPDAVIGPPDASTCAEAHWRLGRSLALPQRVLHDLLG